MVESASQLWLAVVERTQGYDLMKLHSNLLFAITSWVTLVKPLGFFVL